MKAWLKPFGYSDAINDATINAILREFVMSKVSCDEMSNMDMIVELLRPQLEVTKEDIERLKRDVSPCIIMHRVMNCKFVSTIGTLGKKERWLTISICLVDLLS